ncbi:GNAT family N-acetyltransferase [Clostridium sp. 19966]|uniref:GNAT family N-acetyltransferase n=1 Tax=Clostridium sp. 19966 TaxID=2768166 RepID=UPI0028E03FD6|nr:GNAT family N-acetyltransferase [Clostridium sp. 19966]MDT8717544.1 GNAT family N-acetyltransferase [Clostridium sp. 19966]
MKVEFLEREKVKAFGDYCKKHRKELDDSFLYDEDLESFQPGKDNPTYVITKDEEITAAISLIIDDYDRKGKKARFRIFHSEIEDVECYDMLFKAIMRHTEQFNKVFLFIPIKNVKLIQFIEALNFKVERYSFLFLREAEEAKELSLYKDYEIRNFQVNRDEEIWCSIRNAAFAHLQGSETPMTPDMIPKRLLGSDYVEGGMMILYNREKPVGVVRVGTDEYENLPVMYIGPLAIIPEYQGMGLGRNLLRAALAFVKERGCSRTLLSVNAENDRAKRLYLQEGFKEAEAVVCYKYDL